jgi:hypothetical protein
MVVIVREGEGAKERWQHPITEGGVAGWRLASSPTV